MFGLFSRSKAKRFVKKANSTADICGQLSYNFIDENGKSVAVWDLRGKPRDAEDIPKVWGGAPVGVGSTYVAADVGGQSHMFDGEEWKPL